ncbi:hypothetical protein [Dielma fastidiosa]|uniref:hypothetical protein n=1 Tax=Dielma fastidiosa TaxID=1034346 RepID=UPI003569B4EB
MDRFFDFTHSNERTLKVKISDRYTLLLLPPQLDLVEELEAFDKEKTKMSDIKQLVLKILRNNKGKRQVNESDINNLSMDNLFSFIKTYVEFVGEVAKDPN